LDLGEIKPRKTVFVSTLHNGAILAADHRQILKLYRWAKSCHMPSHFIKKITKSYLTRFHHRESLKFYEDVCETTLYKQIFNEDFRADMESIFGALFSLINEEVLTSKALNAQSIVIYADSDPNFIKVESRQMAKFLGIEPIYLENMDHDHLVFDVNKSADVILNFLMA
jgi:hypothetical protein